MIYRMSQLIGSHQPPYEVRDELKALESHMRAGVLNVRLSRALRLA